MSEYPEEMMRIYGSASNAVAVMCEQTRARNIAETERLLSLAGLALLSQKEDLERLHGGAEWRAGQAVEADVCLAAVVSPYTARRDIHLGEQLWRRFPTLREYGLAGDLDAARIRTVIEILSEVDEDLLHVIEEDAADTARYRAPSLLRSEIMKMLIANHPEEAEKINARKRKRGRRVTVSPEAHGMAKFTALLMGEEAAAALAMVQEMAATVCKEDRRGEQQLLADATLGLLHGQRQLQCQCERTETDDPCPMAHYIAPPMTTVQVVVHVDAETLIGVIDHPGNLTGVGPLDAATVRYLATDATWSIIIDNARTDLALRQLGQTPEPRLSKPMPAGHVPDPQRPTTNNNNNADAGSSHREPTVADTDADSSGSSDAGTSDTGPTGEDADTNSSAAATETTDADADGGVAGEGTEPGATEPGDTESHRAPHQARRVSKYADLPPRARRRFRRQDRARRRKAKQLYLTGPVSKQVPGLGVMLDELFRLLDENPALLNFDGHGGHSIPPPGALTYQPTRELRRLVARKYKTCSFPSCVVSIDKCQWDHVVSFNHRDPLNGGWTIAENAAPACAFHNQLKEDGRYRVIVLANGIVVWISRDGLRNASLPDHLGGPEVPEPERDEKPTPRPELPPDPGELPDDDPAYEPTWWEANMQPGDLPPTLADIAVIDDPEVQQLVYGLRAHYDDHLAMVNHRWHHQPAPF